MRAFLTLASCGVVALTMTTSAYALHGDAKCDSCHVPHKSDNTVNAPLWNPRLDVTTYTPYSSLTIKAQVGQPNGISKLCLGCHGVEDSSSYHLGGGAFASAGNGDMSNDHPISFQYDSALATLNGYLFDPSSAPSHLGATSTCTIGSSGRETCVVSYIGSTNTIAQDLLRPADSRDPNSPRDRVECVTCHDPHNKLNIVYNYTDLMSTTVPQPVIVKKYMAMTNAGGFMCKTCHTYGSNYGQPPQR